MDDTVKETADHFKRDAVRIGDGVMNVEALIRRVKSFEKARIAVR